jgi:hypothetical protein
MTGRLGVRGACKSRVERRTQAYVPVRAPTEESKEDEGEVTVFQMIDEKTQKREDRGAGVEVKVCIWDRRSVGEVRVQRVRWWREKESRIWTRTSRGEQGSESHGTGPHHPLPAQTSMRAANKVTDTCRDMVITMRRSVEATRRIGRRRSMGHVGNM